MADLCGCPGRLSKPIQGIIQPGHTPRYLESGTSESRGDCDLHLHQPKKPAGRCTESSWLDTSLPVSHTTADDEPSCERCRPRSGRCWPTPPFPPPPPAVHPCRVHGRKSPVGAGVATWATFTLGSDPTGAGPSPHPAQQKGHPCGWSCVGSASSPTRFACGGVPPATSPTSPNLENMTNVPGSGAGGRTNPLSSR